MNRKKSKPNPQLVKARTQLAAHDAQEEERRAKAKGKRNKLVAKVEKLESLELGVVQDELFPLHVYQ